MKLICSSFSSSVSREGAAGNNNGGSQKRVAQHLTVFVSIVPHHCESSHISVLVPAVRPAQRAHHNTHCTHTVVVVYQILAGVRTATVNVQDVSPQHDCSKLEVTVVSPFFEGLAKFKRRNMVNGSLNGLRKEPGFHADIVQWHLYSPAEAATSADGEQGEK